MDQRQADRIIALLEKIAHDTNAIKYALESFILILFVVAFVGGLINYFTKYPI